MLLRFRSPLNALGGMGGQNNWDDMEMDDANVDIVDNIDVRQILGLTDDFLPQTQAGNFWAKNQGTKKSLSLPLLYLTCE